MARRKALNIVERESVVAVNGRFPSQLTNISGQVVYEGVVVVDDEDHVAKASASMIPRALSSVSRYSSSGSESATIPPPAPKYIRPAWDRAVRIAILVSSAPVTLT